MANVGRSQAGNTLIGQGVTAGPRFAPIGTDSGLTANGLLVAHGTSPFTSTTPGTNGQVIIGGTGVAPAFATITSSGGTISFTSGVNSLNMEAGATVPTTFTANSGSATPAANNLNILGASTAAGTSPVTTSGAGSTLTINVQKSQAIAATDATKIGLANFNSAQFSVDANGFVSASSTGLATTITGDSGGSLSPSSNNWNVFGLSGSKTSGSGSTLTVKSPPFADASSSATSSLNTGEFVTGLFTRTLPASAGLADGDLIIYVCTSASQLTIQAVGAQTIRIGNQVSSAAGTAKSNAIGDSISLRFRATDQVWYAVSVQGTWTLA